MAAAADTHAGQPKAVQQGRLRAGFAGLRKWTEELMKTQLVCGGNDGSANECYNGFRVRNALTGKRANGHGTSCRRPVASCTRWGV